MTWRDGKEKLKAVVIERRPADYWKRSKKRKIKNSGMSSIGKLGVFFDQEELVGLKADEISYYVHYEAHDRYDRLFDSLYIMFFVFFSWYPFIPDVMYMNISSTNILL